MTPRPGITPSTILSTTVAGLTPVLGMIAIYITLRGHNAPGGGFAGGLIVGIILVLRYLTDGPDALRRLPVDPVVLIGVGLGVAVLTGMAPLVVGESFMESAIWKFDVPLIGSVKVVSSAIFDLGVFILVSGVVAAILVALSEADDEARRGLDDRPGRSGSQEVDR